MQQCGHCSNEGGDELYVGIIIIIILTPLMFGV